MGLMIPGPAGRLEALLWLPEHGATPRAAACVCHPHPAHGGTLKNNVVHRTARALQQAGLAVLRFNFRGVGRSAGEHDGRGAEDDDLTAALDWLEHELPELPLWAAGFSFGARTAARVATRDARVERVILVALPVLAYPCAFAADIEQPGLAVMAGDDDFGTLAALRERFPGLAARLETVEVPGADHFFTGKLPELHALVAGHASRALNPA
jgi:hypothetical protein